MCLVEGQGRLRRTVSIWLRTEYRADEPSLKSCARSRVCDGDVRLGSRHPVSGNSNVNCATAPVAGSPAMLLRGLLDPARAGFASKLKAAFSTLRLLCLDTFRGGDHLGRGNSM